MTKTMSFEVSRLIRRLRGEAGLTQAELAERVGTTQSVISRLESDDYEGHSLSMLYRIGAALNRRIAVAAVAEGSTRLSVAESAPSYGPEAPAAGGPDDGLTAEELDRLVDHVAERFRDEGVTRADIEEAIRWARDFPPRRSVEELRGALEVGPGDTVDDVRRARARRGRQETPR